VAKNLKKKNRFSFEKTRNNKSSK